MDTPPTRSTEPSRLKRAAAGLTLALAGAAVLVFLVVISNSSSDLAQKLLFRLGLAASALISVVGQGLVIFGLWLVWKARQERASRR